MNSGKTIIPHQTTTKSVTMNEIEVKINVEWPGWPLSENQFGDEFDEDARIRMIRGAQKTIPFILKHKHKFQNQLLEIGPFFNPLLKSTELESGISKSSNIVFLENDPYAAKWLEYNHNCCVIKTNINSPTFEDDFINELLCEKHTLKFDLIIISQVLNYVDSYRLLKYMYSFLKHDGFIFINNVCNYGIPQLFSANRFKSNNDLIKACRDIGYSVVEHHFLPLDVREPEERLILVLSQNGLRK